MFTFGVLGLSCEAPAAPKPPGFHTTAREPKRGHLRVPEWEREKSETLAVSRRAVRRRAVRGRAVLVRVSGRTQKQEKRIRAKRWKKKKQKENEVSKKNKKEE